MKTVTFLGSELEIPFKELNSIKKTQQRVKSACYTER